MHVVRKSNLLKNCFIIPIHPEKYEYAYNLVKGNIPFFTYFIFTNRDEYEKFEMKHIFGNMFEKIILEDFGINLKMSREEGIITAKKFYALKTIYNSAKFENLIVIDAETEFLNKDIDKIERNIELVLSSNIIPCIYENSHSELVIGNSINVLPESWREKLLELTMQKKLSHWFTQGIPIYQKKYLKEFFETLGDFEKKLNFWTFDYVIFYLFLAYRRYTFLVNQGEICIFDNIGNLRENYVQLCVQKIVFEREKDKFINDNHSAFVIYALDRK